VGVLIDVLQYGTVDTYVFRTKHGSLMAPALKAVFVETDVENRKIVVDRERLEEVAVLED
jgi:16S rRNA processing protein RimM